MMSPRRVKFFGLMQFCASLRISSSTAVCRFVTPSESEDRATRGAFCRAAGEVNETGSGMMRPDTPLCLTFFPLLLTDDDVYVGGSDFIISFAFFSKSPALFESCVVLSYPLVRESNKTLLQSKERFGGRLGGPNGYDMRARSFLRVSKRRKTRRRRT